MRKVEAKEDGQADAGTQLRAVIDRILRLKEEGDALTSDIRDIYAEAKSNGFDKTALGLVVAQLRKRAKDPAKYTELSEVASTYLAAYEGGTRVALRAHAHAIDSQAKRTEAEPQAALSQERTSVRSRPSDGGGTVAPNRSAAAIAAEAAETVVAVVAPAGRASDESPAPIHAAPPIDITIPAFLLRGDPACTISEPSK